MRLSVLPPLCVLVAACGDDGMTVVEPPPDTAPPRLLSSVPAAMSSDAPAESPLVLVFSEPMDPSSGEASLMPGGTSFLASDGEWAANQVLTFRPSFETGQGYTVQLRGFRDAAGNALGSGETLVFTIGTRPDTTAPILIATSPVDGGETPVGTASIRLTFTEAMDQSMGTVVSVSGTASVAAGTWSRPETLDLPISGLVAGQTYRLQPQGFQDVAGNAANYGALLADGTLDFTVPDVMDTTAPVVVATQPIEGAPEVDPATTVLELSFSEAMDPTRAAARFTEGPNESTLTGAWNAEQTTIRFTVALRGATTYSLSPNGFQDLAGNALDGAAFLGDGKLDFTTRVIPDAVPPTVTSAMPADGATMVPLSVGQVQVVFDEAMQPTPTTLLENAGSMTVTATLSGTWTAGNTTFTAPVSGLVLGASYRIDFRAFRDVAGNTLATTALGDGYLDFTTPPDTVSPRVVTVSPTEGANTITPALTTISVTFDEPIQPASAAAVLAGGGTSQPLTPVIDPSAREASYDVTGLISPATTYTLDLTGVLDLAGNALDPAPVLGNGILDFSAPAAPNGFSCSTPITVPYGQPFGLGTRFTVGSGTSGRNGSFTCDGSGAGDDVVIEYRKLSGTVASGGQLLRVRASAPSGGLNVEVLSGQCSGSTATQEHCYSEKQDLDVYLDRPAGTYYVWVSNADGATGQSFQGATVDIEEVPPTSGEGEGCFLPYTDSSSNYTAPAAAGDAAVWTILPNAINAFDRDTVIGGPGSISCIDDPSTGDLHGVDAVVRYTPSRMGSVLQIQAQSQNPAANIHMEVLDRCAPPGATNFGCSARALQHEVVATSTAPIFVWVATEGSTPSWPGVTVSVREIVPGPGETCATGQVITSPGSINIANVSGERLSPPSCLVNGGPVEWYRYTVTGGRVQLRASTGLEIGVVDANGGPGEACQEDLSLVGLGGIYPVGTTLCFAVPTGAGGTDFDLSDVSDNFMGVGTSSVVVNVNPATTWPTAGWMVSGSGFVHVGGAGAGVQRFPRSALTATAAVNATTVFSGAEVGDAAFAFRDDRLFGVDDVTGSSTSRIYRLWDGALATAYAARAWDLTPSYPAGEDTRTLTNDGTSFVYATHRSGGFDVYTLAETAAQSPVPIGANATVESVVGLAADATYLYIVGRAVVGGQQGVFRLDRSDLATPAAPAVLLAPLELDLNGVHAAYLDDPSSPTALYVRGGSPSGIMVIESPDSDAPVRRGFLIQGAPVGDRPWTYLPDLTGILLLDSSGASPRLYLIQ